ncbi:hypothetical protein QBC33DRAFT_531698 [Phialemonium atrogriseum]|uniref:Homeobox domain-containing protein n=1 Tax=Phialemonium atrogriseum TaxID=1093897 RepID=A0AAJ0FIK8_9PEZI|nr:uncharacterized protein QBC33DRAFT_531698 [Phialemonium atrogriseum]KAK1769706.1 hypothetical protein QBC33DRAFT_531698 [Phialemonium atrogriseum]
MDGHASSSPSPSSPDPHNNAVPERQSPTTGTDDSHESLLQSSQPSLPESGSQGLASERHPKGKRKRTAAKDKAVLEAAYNANPKPDKTARLELVTRVSLNEKEVQIWFQNRRQNDRRKSRPLSPQEIAALRYGGMQILSSDPMPYNSSEALDASNSSPGHRLSLTGRESTSPAASDAGHASSSDEAEKNAGETGQTMPENSQPNEPSPLGVESSDDSLHLSRSFASSVGYLSNRWNPGSSFSTPSTLGHRAGDDSVRLEPFRPSTCSSARSSCSLPPLPNSQSSNARISLSLEGKAEVISTVPSPPHLPLPRPTGESMSSIAPIRRPSLQRSHSVQPVVTLPPISTLTGSLPTSGPRALPPRLTRGRSRDVHAWEFCCDADNQEDLLTAQAKHESSGSAIAVISLLRSTSSTGSTGGPLQPSSSSKRNAPLGKALARPGMAKKRRLSRASSSVAKLQTSFAGEKNIPAPRIKEESGGVGGKDNVVVLRSPAGSDSDKENWSPDEEGNPQHRLQRRSQPQVPGGGRQPLPSGTTATQQANSRRALGRPLQEHRGPPLLSANRANTAPTPSLRAGKGRHSPLEIFEDSGGRSSPTPGVPDDEVERFMRGEVSPSKKGDVDAVAGLLSLSQGNWR